MFGSNESKAEGLGGRIVLLLSDNHEWRYTIVRVGLGEGETVVLRLMHLPETLSHNPTISHLTWAVTSMPVRCVPI